jgi:hypothetical protein
VSVTPDEFASKLTRTGPEVRTIVEAHVQEYECLLLHVLVADLLRFCIRAFDGGRREELGRCLTVMSEGLIDGDEAVENAVAVSFVEDAEWWDPAKGPFMATWPLALRTEAERQRRWYSRRSDS